MARKDHHRDAEAWLLETLADSGVDAGRATSSLKLYRQAMKIRAELDDYSGIAIGHVGLGRAYCLRDSVAQFRKCWSGVFRVVIVVGG